MEAEKLNTYEIKAPFAPQEAVEDDRANSSKTSVRAMPSKEKAAFENQKKSQRPSDGQICWYVMRTVACGCHKTVSSTLQADGIEFFQPMRCVVKQKNGKAQKIMEPLVSNIFFVHDSKSRLLPYTVGTKCRYFQFYYDRCSKIQSDCLRIPDKQMEDFLTIYNASMEDPQIFSPEDIGLTKGQRIRIIGGAFDGVEGVFQRVKGHRKRRLVVTLDGFVSISAAIEPEYVCKI